MEYTFDWNLFNWVLGILYFISFFPSIKFTPAIYKNMNPGNMPIWLVFISVWLVMPIFLLKELMGALFSMLFDFRGGEEEEDEP